MRGCGREDWVILGWLAATLYVAVVAGGLTVRAVWWWALGWALP